MDVMPYDCYMNILNFLDIESIIRLIKTNKNLYNFYKINRQEIFSNKLKKNYNYNGDNAEEIFKKFYRIDFNGKYIIDNKVNLGGD